MPMPYTLTKGPLLTALENALNPTTPADRAVRDSALAELRAGTPITAIPWVSGPGAAVAIPGGALGVRLDTDWFGGPGGGPAGQSTGYWVGYHGDVEAVLREGLIRAIEVSLGLDHGADASSASRRWPVEVHWKCPNPYFEVWVTWRRHSADAERGQVTVILATPPDKSNRLTTDPLQPPTVPGVAPMATPLTPPTSADANQGMWLVTHAKHEPHCADHVIDFSGTITPEVQIDLPGALSPLAKHVWAVPMPSTYWDDTGDVVVVEPPTYAGGADPGNSNAP